MVSARLGSGSLSPAVMVVLGCVYNILAPVNFLTCPVLSLFLCCLCALSHSLIALSPLREYQGSGALPVYLLHDEESGWILFGESHPSSRLGAGCS